MKRKMWNRVASLTLAAMMVIGNLTGLSFASDKADGIAIDDVNFPDKNFQEFVRANYDKDGNESLSQAELDAVKVMRINWREVSDLTGIANFAELTELNCSNNQLEKLDVSENTKLSYLYCESNLLTELDLSSNTGLLELSCGANKLTKLNVSKCALLSGLYCNDNMLETLNVGNNPELKYLYCNNNQLTTLVVSKNLKLESLSCEKNKLTSLYVALNTELKHLFAGDNAINYIDMTKNTLLEFLDVSNNQLTSLNLIKSTYLTSAYCSNNYVNVTLTDGKFDLSTLRGFNVAKASNWVGGTVNGSILTATEPRVTYDYNAGNGYTFSFLMYVDGLTSDVKIDEETFYDKNFCTYVSKNLDKDKNGFLSYSEIDVVDSLDISGLGIADLTGIDVFHSLTVLDCSNNLLEKIDLDLIPNVVELYCGYNRLTSVNLGARTDIILDTTRNSRPITLKADGTFDLHNLAGFDITKASEWVGGTVKGWTLTPKHDNITYSYDCGNGYVRTFRLTVPAMQKEYIIGKVDKEYPAEIVTLDEFVSYKFTPVTSGKFIFYSTCSKDTEADLYDENMQLLNGVAGGGPMGNFNIVYELEAGKTYTLMAGFYSETETGTMKVCVSKYLAGTHTITFDANGGFDGPHPQVIEEGGRCYYPSQEPSRMGYTFLGWAMRPDATEEECLPEQWFNANYSMTLYAIWSRGIDEYVPLERFPGNQISLQEYVMGVDPNKLDITITVKAKDAAYYGEALGEIVVIHGQGMYSVAGIGNDFVCEDANEVTRTYSLKEFYDAVGMTSPSELLTIWFEKKAGCELVSVKITSYMDDPLPTLSYSHTLTLQNNLSINYYVSAKNLLDYDEVTLHVEKDSYDKNGNKSVVETVLAGDLVDVGYGPEYKFRYTGIASYEVGNEVRAYIVATKDGEPYVFNTDTYSVESYCYNQLGKASVAAKLKKLIVDMLNYCSLSQQHFGIRTDALANADLTAAQKAYGSTECKTLNNKGSETTVAGATATISGKTLVLGNNVELKVYMRLPVSLDKSKVMLRIIYKNMSGTNVTKNIPFSEFVYDKKSDEYSVRFAEITAPEFRNVLSLSIYDGSERISNIHNYSIETYAYNRVNSTTSTELMKNLVKAMMMYSDSAVEYFAK